MRWNYRDRIARLGGCSMLAIVLFASTQPAAAQTPDASANPQARQDAGTLGDIVVTAQFKKQNVQDTPIAITAISGDMLRARGQNSVEEISSQAPNVTLTAGGSFTGPALIGFIRGVGQTDFNPALEPGVGLYVDDVYYSTLTGSVLDLLDLERVEVLRGPQGTLAGKNSIGGAIKLFSVRPSDEPNGYVEVGVGSYDGVSIRGATNFTLVKDRLFARISGVSRSRDGYVKTLDYGCTHPGSAFPSQATGADCVTGHEGGVKYTAARLALRWLPTDNLEVNIAGDWSNDDSQPPANILLATGPTIAPIVLPNPAGPPLIWENLAIPGMATGTVGCSFIAYGSNTCDPRSPNNPYVNYSSYNDPRTGLTLRRTQYVKAKGASMNIDWDVSDSLKIQSITGYREYDSGFTSEQDGTPFPVALLFQRLKHDQFSQEVRFNQNLGKIGDLTVGAFYFRANTDMDARVDLGYAGFDFIHGPDPVDTRNWAVFANGIFNLTDDLVLSGGLRYSDDKKDYTYFRHNPDGSLIQPCVGPPGTPGNPPNCLISSLNGVSSSFKDNRIDYRVALTYNFDRDAMVYAQYSTGYKGGGVNPRPFYNVQAVPFAPEVLKSIEIGAKTQFFDRRMRVNVALFHNDYDGVTATFNNCTEQFGPVFGVPCLLNSNAGDARVKGAELEVDVLPVDGLQIDGSLSLLDFKYKSISPATGIGPDAITPYTPKVSWNVGAQYALETGVGTITPRLDVVHRGHVYTSPDNYIGGRIDAYTLLNGRISWEDPDKNWVVALEVRNITDKLFFTSNNPGIPGGSGFDSGAPGLPRTWQLSLRRNF